MKRLYSRRDFQHYTMLRQVLSDLGLADANYLWLISDIEACPQNEAYRKLLHNDPLLLSADDLAAMLRDEDFQWIWAVFCAIPPHYTREAILQFGPPRVRCIDDGSYDPHRDTPKLQHPYADLEIYACDSSCMFLISDDAALLRRFKKSYPLHSEA